MYNAVMGPSASILVVDDDLDLGRILVAQLEQVGYGAHHIASAELALEALESGSYDLLVADVRLPGMDGLALLRAIRARWSDVPVILITAHGSIRMAVSAMTAGASSFLVKPHDRAELVARVDEGLASHAWRAERPPERDLHGMIGNAAPMRAVKADITKAARAQSTVLLRGETGTGKEVAARAIHQESKRRSGPFVAVHCAALPDQLLESELFGYVKGAFTGAHRDRPGRVALAEGGTLFLDEIGDVPLFLQVKLLRLLQQRCFEPVGDSRTRNADVRFIAATHQDLDAMVESGEFREDLYYRLSVIPIWLPPLRAIRADIPALANAFLRRFADENERFDLSFTEAGMDRLVAYDFPGNVRELENLVERMVVLHADRRIDAAVVDRALRRRQPSFELAEAPSDMVSLDAMADDNKRSALLEALSKTKGNRSDAARLLGVSRRTLYNWIKRFNIANLD